MADSGDEVEPADEAYADPYAERVAAFTALLTALVTIDDPELRGEGVRMLTTLRETVKTPPRGQVARVK